MKIENSNFTLNDKVMQFRFRFGTDFCNGTDIGWYLDDVEVYECRAAAAAAGVTAKPE